MLRYLIILTGFVALSGCTRDGQFGVTPRTRLATFAARAENAYPEQVKASSDLPIGVIIDKNDGVLHLFNFSDETVRDAKLWVNRDYVFQIHSLPAKDSVSVSRRHIYNSRGVPLSRAGSAISIVQLQRGDELFNLMGPVFE